MPARRALFVSATFSLRRAGSQIGSHQGDAPFVARQEDPAPHASRPWQLGNPPPPAACILWGSSCNNLLRPSNHTLGERYRLLILLFRYGLLHAGITKLKGIARQPCCFLKIFRNIQPLFPLTRPAIPSGRERTGTSSRGVDTPLLEPFRRPAARGNRGPHIASQLGEAPWQGPNPTGHESAILRQILESVYFSAR